MPCKCSVPGCKTNYASQRGKIDHKGLVFQFPLQDPQRLELWLSLFPRKDFTPSKHSRVCFKHFLPKFLIHKDVIVQKTGEKRHRVKLTSDAYPTIFHDPQSKDDEGEGDGESQSSQTDMEKRDKLFDVQNGYKNTFENWMSFDRIKSFSSFCQEAKHYLGGNRWLYKKLEDNSNGEEECIQFHYTEDFLEAGCHFQRRIFTVTVSSNMHIKVRNEEAEDDLPESSLSGILGEESPLLVYWSQFVAIVTQCSTGIWFNTGDVRTNVCINDCQELSVVEQEDQTTGGLETNESEKDPSSQAPTKKASDVPADYDNEKMLRDEVFQLTRKLCNAVFQRNMLLKRLRNIQDLASINLDMLSLVQIIDGNPEGREEMDKVYRLVQTILSDTEEMSAGQNNFPVWTEDYSKLANDDSPKDDLLQLKYPAFLDNPPPNTDIAKVNFRMARGWYRGYKYGSDLDDNYYRSWSNNLAYNRIKMESNEDDEIDDDDDDDGNESDEAGKPSTSENVVKNKRKNINPTKRLECEFCGKIFVKEETLFLHKRIMHKDKFFIQCEICGLRTKSRSVLKVHMLKHSDERKYQCNICGLRLKYPRSLSSHLKYSHSDERLYKCAYCDTCFKRKDNKAHHEKSCAKKTVRRRSYRGADNLLHCHVCDKGYKCSVSLKRHMACHSDERPFPCTVCEKSFRLKMDLRRHQKTVHKEERPYQCSLCPLKFKMNCALKAHQLVHLEVGSFRCDICDKRFKWLRSLQKHQVVHEKEDYRPTAPTSQEMKMEVADRQHEQTSNEQLLAHSDNLPVHFQDGRSAFNTEPSTTSAASASHFPQYFHTYPYYQNI